jgi:hypothetical protein
MELSLKNFDDEIECIEPDLYFNLSANSLDQFVAAL